MTLRLRGGQTVLVVLGSAPLYVSAHQQKQWVVALKYPSEEDYRYLVASEMSWRAADVASAYTLRWPAGTHPLIELSGSRMQGISHRHPPCQNKKLDS